MVESSSSTVQPKRESVDGDDDARKPGKWDLASFGICRSCDPCGRRKKKCDRGQPCRRCQQTGDECTYSKRRWHLPQGGKLHALQQQADPDRVRMAQDLQEPSTPGAMPRQGSMLSLKRCRLSASPATGLVGMRENTFISDFCGCVGFLPLTTQSHIRETMVKIMLHPVFRERPALGAVGGEAGQCDDCGTGGGFGDAFGRKELPVGPSTCIFWCAVALGGLVKGSPIESVATYTQRATDALTRSHSGLPDAEVAQAWTNLGYLYGFMGDTAKFEECLTLSETYLTATIEQGSTENLPVGFAEIIKDRQKATTAGNMETFCSTEYRQPEMTGISTEHEAYRYVMQSFRAFQQALYSKMLSKSPSDHGSSRGAEPVGEVGGDQPHQDDVVPEPQQMAEAMASVWFQDDTRPIRFEHLGELVDRCLGFEAAGDGDGPETLKRFGRCVEVFTRYPGLCRFHWVGAHRAHAMMAGLAALDIPGAREEYERLRAAFNASRLHGSRPAPPLEEWQGVSSICDDLHCRAVDGLFSSGHMKAFSKARKGMSPSENGGGAECGEDLGLAKQDHDGHSAASIVPERRAFTSAECPPRSGETGSDVYGTSSGTGETEQYLESTGVEHAASVCATFPYHYLSDKELDEDDANSDINVVRGGDGAGFSSSGMVGAPSEDMSITPEAFNEGARGEMQEGVSAADWLDVTVALLDEASEFGEACC